MRVEQAEATQDGQEVLSVYETELRAWMSQWFDQAISRGYVRPPFILDDAKAQRLEGLFIAGLTPGEGAQAFFCVTH